jgi:hypothetical protein
MPKITKLKKKVVKRRKRKTGGSVIDRIGPIEFSDDDGIKINIYGRSGTGKTTFWATFPKPILAIICSGGSKPGELRSLNTAYYRKNVDQVTLEKTSDIQEVVELQQTTSRYATIVLDHATGLQDVVLKEVLGLDEIPVQLSWGIAGQQQWGQVAVQTKERLRSLLNLYCNVVIVAQEREFNSEVEDAELVMPNIASALTPSVTGWLNPACDYICQTFIRSKTQNKEIKVGDKTTKVKQKIGGVEYCLRTAPHELFTTKFRLPKGSVELPDVIVDPDFDKIQKLIKGG